MGADFKNLITPLLRWWLLIVIPTVLAGSITYLIIRQQPPIYKSSAMLVVGYVIDNPNPSSGDLLTTQQLASMYADLGNSPSLRNATQQALGLETLPEIVVQQPNGSNIIDIIVAAQDALLAQAVAHEVMWQLILRTPAAQPGQQERLTFVNEQLNEYEAAIKQTQEAIDRQRNRLAETTNIQQIITIQNDLQALQTKLRQQQSGYGIFLPNSQEEAKNVLRIIEPASSAWAEKDSNWDLVAASATVAFMLAVSAAYILSLLDDTIKRPEDVIKLTRLPTLVGITKMRADDHQLVTAHQFRSPISEAFRILWTAVQFAMMDSYNETILVTSPVHGDGKSTIAANLAIVMAHAGHNVLLIDTDLRTPSQHELFGVSDESGLTSLLAVFKKEKWNEGFQTAVEETIQETMVKGLSLLASGPRVNNPAELLASYKMDMLLMGLQMRYDYVVLDSSSLLAVTDTAVLTPLAGSILLVANPERNRKEYLKQASELLQTMEAKAIGWVLNELPPKNMAYGTYHYNTPYTTDNTTGGSTGLPKPHRNKKLRNRLGKPLQAGL